MPTSVKLEADSELHPAPRRELQFAPAPPSNMTGKLGYGYAIPPDVVRKAIYAAFGDEKTDPQQVFSTFRWRCRKAISPTLDPKAPHFEVRRDIEEQDDETLCNFFVAIATNRARVLPPKEEVERLKVFLETDDEPQWCEIA
ncbi:hypothetical protein SCHPADRAFT_576699 [Schizopora paradoxa]|uniref:Uncharacterized protein n=1 Tax=Schizopora paradoxa TaxID=27342 RepID=A0A0H2RIA0_9AGAM|nr:hypothetical protein SCHPADRAFT_576699 [Schizopora paradoxa]